MGKVRIKRIYEPAHASDGARFLVERLWPRGISKDRARLAAWLKDVAPSAELRTWYGHDVAKWAEFRRRYTAELKGNTEALGPVREAARRGDVTLLFAASDPDHCSALVLKEYVERS